MKIALLGCKGTTLDLLQAVLEERPFGVDQVVTLSRGLAEKNQVAFYRGEELEARCGEQGIPLHRVRSYNLKHEADAAFFAASGIDLLVVLGWERLIPAPILAGLGRFACGMHGSPWGLPRGRGRSPLNWSILEGHSRFVTYLFRYDPRVDAGDLLGFRIFDIHPFDTIASLHAKNRIAMFQLLRRCVPAIEDGSFTSWPQPTGGATYFPRRRPEDGLIDWRQSTAQVHSQVRALAFPYPGAFCFFRGGRVQIDDAVPFDRTLFDGVGAPGTVVDVSRALRQFVVRTGDGSLLVRRFRGPATEDLARGDVLEGGDARRILRQIIGRYAPELPEEQREIRPPDE